MVAAAPVVTLYPLARRTEVEIVWNGHDVSADLRPYLLGLDYTESIDGQADDVQLTIENKDGIFTGDWRPEFGDEIDVALTVDSWIANGETRRLRLGTCAVDEIEDGGPPATVSVKAVSAGLSTGLRRTKRTRSWREASLQDIAEDICAAHGLELLYDAPTLRYATSGGGRSAASAAASLVDLTIQVAALTLATGEAVTLETSGAVPRRPGGVRYKRVDQKAESDLAFLSRLCGDAGFALKVIDSRICIFLEADLEAGDAVVTLAPGGPGIQRWRLRRSATELYVSAAVKYSDPLTGRLVEAIVGESRREGGETVPEEPCLRETLRLESATEAERLALHHLRRANLSGAVGSIDLLGDPALVAGAVVQCDAVGGLDGRYLVTEARHRVVGGYTAALTLRRTMEA